MISSGPATPPSPCIDRHALLGVELGEIGRLEGRITGGEVHRGMKHCFRFVRNAFAALLAGVNNAESLPSSFQ